MEELTVGEAIVAVKKIQQLQPYRPRGGTFTTMPAENYTALAKGVLAPAICNMKRRSYEELLGMCEELFDGTSEYAANEFDECYRRGQYLLGRLAFDDLSTQQGLHCGIERPETSKPRFIASLVR